MSQPQVNIIFEVMAKALRKHVREKAAHFNNTIVYLKNGVIVEEDPRNHLVKVITPSASKGK